MVTTRGRQPILVTQTAPIEKDATVNSPTRPYLHDNADNPNINNHEVQVNGGSVKTGSRLRKRQRTDSSHADSVSSSMKRQNIKKALSPDERGELEAASRTSPQATAVSHNIEDQTSGSPKSLSPSISPDSSSQTQELLSVLANGEGKQGNKYEMVLAQIIGRGEKIDNAKRPLSDLEAEEIDKGYPIDPMTLKVESLPILDYLASNILKTLAKSTYQEILVIVTDPDSESGQAYANLKKIFGHTKKVYSIHDVFLSTHELGFEDQPRIDAVRKANLATYVSSVFGSKDVGFYHLNEYFLETFVADGNRLLKSQAGLFLDLKTHAYISAMSSGERTRAEVLEDLFPTNLEERLLSRRPGAKALAPSEADFYQRARNRCKALSEEPETEEAINALPDKYIWEDFLRDVSGYVSKNFDTIVGTPARKPLRPRRSQSATAKDQQQKEAIHETKTVQPSAEAEKSISSSSANDNDDIVAKAARATQFALQDGNDGEFPQHTQQPKYQQSFNSHPQQYQPSPVSHEHIVQQQHVFYQQQQQNLQYHGPYQAPYAPPIPGQMIISPSQPFIGGDANAIPYPTQSAPTQILYERARMAATSKSSPSNRKGGPPSQRRPWSTEEENALMAGLDRVKGPHWSQILAMFGPGGTVNESLKDRNQVQLKDKARNLKLFFLKSGIEVPYYLQFVTGDLKKRAPTQAAKNEVKTGSADDTADPDTNGTLADIEETLDRQPVAEERTAEHEGQVMNEADTVATAADDHCVPDEDGTATGNSIPSNGRPTKFQLKDASQSVPPAENHVLRELAAGLNESEETMKKMNIKDNEAERARAGAEERHTPSIDQLAAAAAAAAAMAY